MNGILASGSFSWLNARPRTLARARAGLQVGQAVSCSGRGLNEGHEERDESPLEFKPLCNFVSFVVRQMRTLLVNVISRPPLVLL